MNRHKLALLAASLAGTGVLVWGLFGTLHNDADDGRTAADAAADSPIARMVARLGPPDRTASGFGWDAWSRAATWLRIDGALAAGTSDGDVGRRGGRSFWDGDADLDGARGIANRRADLPGDGAWRLGGRPEPAVRGIPYRIAPPGLRTILTSGHRVDEPEIRLPDTAAVSLMLEEHPRVPVRVEVCVTKTGQPKEAKVIHGSGVAAVDHYVARQMLDGRYRPLWQDGRPVAFCERTTVVLGS